MSKGPFTQAIFVAATRCNFCRAKVASSFKHVRDLCDIEPTNRTENPLFVGNSGNRHDPNKRSSGQSRWYLLSNQTLECAC